MSSSLEEMAAAVEAVRAGRVVGLPTDTVYGLGVDPLNPAAVERLFELKGRPDWKPVGVLVGSLEQAEMIGELGDQGRIWAELYWPGALTLVVRAKVILADWVGDRQRRNLGVRMPDHPAALALLGEVGPLAVTSANRSGEPELLDHVATQEVFGDQVVCLPGASPGGTPSTVVDISGGNPTVLRSGPIEVGSG